MPIKLEFRIHDDYLEADFLGKRDKTNELEESYRLWSQIPIQCERHGLNKIIAISRLDKRLSLDNTFSFADQFKALGWKANYKMAGVAFDKQLYTEYELLVTFINNFGYECRLFNNMKDAKKWLLNP